MVLGLLGRTIKNFHRLVSIVALNYLPSPLPWAFLVNVGNKRFIRTLKLGIETVKLAVKQRAVRRRHQLRIYRLPAGGRLWLCVVANGEIILDSKQGHSLEVFGR